MDAQEFEALWNDREDNTWPDDSEDEYGDDGDDGEDEAGTWETAEEAFEFYDKNDDGFIDVDEFAKFFEYWCTICPFSGAQAMFHFFDFDNDQVLTPSEWDEVFKYWQDDTNNEWEDYGDAFTFYDENTDGVVDVDEFT